MVLCIKQHLTKQHLKLNSCRSNHQRLPIEIGVPKYFTKFTGKHLFSCEF